MRASEARASAFSARRRAIERIGLPHVRNHRLSLLEQEEERFHEQLERRAQILPEMTPLLLVRVEPEKCDVRGAKCERTKILTHHALRTTHCRRRQTWSLSCTLGLRVWTISHMTSCKQGDGCILAWAISSRISAIPWSRRSTGLISTPCSMRRRSTCLRATHRQARRGSSATTLRRSSSFVMCSRSCRNSSSSHRTCSGSCCAAMTADNEFRPSSMSALYPGASPQIGRTADLDGRGRPEGVRASDGEH